MQGAGKKLSKRLISLKSDLDDLSLKYELLTLILLLMAYFFLSFHRVASFPITGMGDGDAALVHNFFWNLACGSSYLTKMQPTNLLAHLSITPFLIVFPFYLFARGVGTLHLIKFLFILLGALPVYLIARNKLDSKLASLLIAIAYLFVPMVLSAQFNIFYRAYFFIPLFLASFYFYQRKKMGPFLFFLVLALLVKENAALIAIMLAIYSYLNKRDRRWVLVPLISGLGWLIASISIMHVIGFRFGFYPRELTVVFELTDWGLIAHNLYHMLTHIDPILFLLSLPSAPVLGIALPIFLQNTFRSRSIAALAHHYALITPVLVLSLIYTVNKASKFFSSFKFAKKGWIEIIAALLIFSYLFSPQSLQLPGDTLNCLANNSWGSYTYYDCTGRADERYVSRYFAIKQLTDVINQTSPVYTNTRDALLHLSYKGGEIGYPRYQRKPITSYHYFLIDKEKEIVPNLTISDRSISFQQQRLAELRLRRGNYSLYAAG